MWGRRHTQAGAQVRVYAAGGRWSRRASPTPAAATVRRTSCRSTSRLAAAVAAWQESRASRSRPC